MKKLFIYYSLTGSGDYVSDYMKKDGYDVIKLKVKKELPKATFFRILVGGYKALVGYEDELLNDDIDLDKYDEIVIGSPIWNSRLSTPVQTFINKNDLSNKILSFILYSGSGTSDKATAFINGHYPDAKIIDLKEPRKNKNEIKKL